MIRGLLIYLLVGTILMFFLELFWDRLELEDPENGVELSMRMRVEVILLWPVLVLATILGIINGNDDDTVGPGYGT